MGTTGRALPVQAGSEAGSPTKCSAPILGKLSIAISPSTGVGFTTASLISFLWPSGITACWTNGISDNAGYSFRRSRLKPRRDDRPQHASYEFPLSSANRRHPPAEPSLLPFQLMYADKAGPSRKSQRQVNRDRRLSGYSCCDAIWRRPSMPWHRWPCASCRKRIGTGLPTCSWRVPARRAVPSSSGSQGWITLAARRTGTTLPGR